MELTSSTTSVPEIGPARAKALSAAYDLETVEDLLRFYPRKYVDRSEPKPIADLEAGKEQAVRATPVSATKKGKPGSSSRRLEVRARGPEGQTMSMTWFRGIDKMKYVMAGKGELVFIGEPQWYGPQLSMSHPEFYEPSGDLLHAGRIVPVYPGSADMESAGLTEKKMRSVMHELACNQIEKLKVPSVPAPIREEFDLMEGTRARRAAHFPESKEELEAALRRIEIDEYLSLQLFMQRLYRQRKSGPEIRPEDEELAQKYLESLSFELTGAQKSALSDIGDDLGRGDAGRMKRLVQGDVGSGKTVVATAALLCAVSAGYQAAFLAPTTVLAEQHYRTLRSQIRGAGLEVDVRLLTGRLSASEQSEEKRRIQNGKTDVVVGTHALLEGDVEFGRLGFGVIDEQQRFGVRQRQRLFEASGGAHMLLTSATPIPRSLAMGMYGDLDMSSIDEMPPGRKPVDTYWNTAAQREDIYEFIRREVERGYRAFVVYPRVDRDPDSDLQSVRAGRDRLQQRFPEAGVEMVHGGMDDAKKSEVMQRFSEGSAQILVATTVIEVGVDVEDATAIVVEDADRLGLSQLHQLRGRVGRSDVQSFCVLVTEGEVTDKARRRLGVMQSTNDGFEVAKADLKIRGAGDLFSTQQSGMPSMRLGDPSQAGDLMETAQSIAERIFEADPELENHQTLAGLLKRRLSPENRSLARIG